jgi:hypothetical protein
MFEPLSNPKLIDIYKSTFEFDEFPQKIVELLENLISKPYAEKLSVVQSIGQLYLTTALTWNDQSHNDVIRIREKFDKNEMMILLSYHTNSFKEPETQCLRSLDETVDYIDLYVMRLLETKYGKL